MSLPIELWLEVLNNLLFVELISAHQVNRTWRALIPSIDESTQVTLFRLALKAIAGEAATETRSPVSLQDRITYVEFIERYHKILIPEPYRTVLMEWPVKNPPPGYHWPDGVRRHASGFCSCDQHRTQDNDCICTITEVEQNDVTLMKSVLQLVLEDQPIDCKVEHPDSRYELFARPPRLYTEVQNQHTRDFISKHPPEMWDITGAHPLRGSTNPWMTLHLRTLRLSRYTIKYTHPQNDDQDEDEEPTESAFTGMFMMILEGPARGEIHGWDFGWYNGFEAASFFDWRYEESQRGVEDQQQFTKVIKREREEDSGEEDIKEEEEVGSDPP